MKKVILKVPIDELTEAAKVAQDFNKWYNTPQWDKHKVRLAGKFDVHETETGSIVVNIKK